MAITTTGATNTQDIILYNSDIDETEDENTTNSSPTVYTIMIKNNHGATDAYLKIYNTQGDITVGTTAPEIILRAHAAAEITTWFVQDGVYLGGLSMACVQETGTAGTPAPAAAVNAWFIYR